MSELVHSSESNSHISLQALSTTLRSELLALGGQLGRPLSLAPLGETKECIDSTTKVVVSPQRGAPAAVIICSMATAPELTARGVDVAEKVRDTLGPKLGAAIIRPLCNGYIQGLSYTLLPFYSDFSSFRPVRRAQTRLIRRQLLNWLQQATVAAVATNNSKGCASKRFRAVLKHLEEQRLFAADIQAAISDAVARIDSGEWQPRHSFDHNDLWLGNVMLVSKLCLRAQNGFPFVLIDWPGANPLGYGIYDLIRIAHDLKLSPQVLREELIGHSQALQCDVGDTRGHLLAALGHLHQNLENFPEHRFVKLAEFCWQRLNRALSAQ